MPPSDSRRDAPAEATSARLTTVAARLREALADAGIAAEEARPGMFVFELPGTRKLATPCRLVVGDHAVAVHAFVCRNPDENHEAVYRWLLTRNLKTYGVAFAIDTNGDIYLAGKIAHESVTAPEIDRLLGSVLAGADESFNTLLELGFAASIRREWAWRVDRGESTRNLDAFRGWLESTVSGPGS